MPGLEWDEGTVLFSEPVWDGDGMVIYEDTAAIQRMAEAAQSTRSALWQHAPSPGCQTVLDTCSSQRNPYLLRLAQQGEEEMGIRVP